MATTPPRFGRMWKGVLGPFPVEGFRHCSGRLVTVAMRAVEFHEPVFVGDLVSFYADTVRVGRTSITVKVEVEAERRRHGKEKVRVTEAEVVYVHVDAANQPVPIDRWTRCDFEKADPA